MNIYSTSELLEVIDLSHKPATFLTQAFFGQEILFGTDTISFDMIDGVRKLAPFVSPCVEGKPIIRDGFTTKTFKPPYLKPKMALTPCDSFTRMPGERIGGSMSARQRADLQIRKDLLDQAGIIDNRIEWMAAQVLTNGYIDVVGDQYPLARVDFGRSLSNIEVLAGGDLWSNPAATPVTNIREWATVVANNDGGAVTDIVLGANVWAQLARHQEFNDLYKYTQPLGGNLPTILPQVQDVSGVIYHGAFGEFRIWTYTATYDDGAGSVPFIGSNDVILVAKQGASAGVQAFGAIKDMDSLVPAKYFPKQWLQNDPSAIFTMTQSAPLVIPKVPNNTFRATVL